MEVVSGSTVICIGSYACIIIGMPGARQVVDTTSLSPPAARSARVLSNLTWYSGVRGASCPRPGGLAGSNGGWPTAPGTMALVHWPVSAGYIASSNAGVAVGMHNAAAVNTIVPIAARYTLTLPPLTSIV